MLNCIIGWFLVQPQNAARSLIRPNHKSQPKNKRIFFKSSHNVNISKVTVSGNIILSINPYPPYTSQGGNKTNKKA